MTETITRFERQADTCAAMGSPFTADLTREAVADYRAGDRAIVALLDSLREYSRPGLHLAGALHYLALTGDAELARHYPSTGGDGDASAAWLIARDIIARTPERITSLLLRTPQTNEPARPMPILAACLFVAATFGMTLRLREIGASAGLNLRFDRFGYDGGDWSWGDLTSRLVLRNCIAAGRPRALGANLEVGDRRGCDLHPLDPRKEADCLRLTSFVWADQKERLARLRGALAVARTLRAPIDEESYLTWLPREGRPIEGCVTTVVHSVVEEHFSLDEKEALAERIAGCSAGASASAPFAHVSMELDGRAYRTSVRTWPGPRNPVTICLSDGHAQDIVWSASA
ncbi:MAG TPA: DUF2332 domain-containing protein [Candidatus Cybelea sp.]|jgi:hypothetical protein